VNTKRLLKTGVAVAAVILLAVALFLNLPTAKAVTIEKIYRAIERAKNVHISSFVPDKKEPTQQEWVSRELNLYVTKTGKYLVLWDIPNGTRKTKYLDANLVETASLSTEMVSEIEKTISGSLGLLPFANLSVIPDDAEWKKVAGEDLESNAEDIEVYELSWLRQAHDGSIGFRRWRVFVDSRTNLPCKTEFYRKLPSDSQYSLITVKVVEYLSNNEIEAVIEEASF
jgi:hypothetical protein